MSIAGAEGCATVGLISNLKCSRRDETISFSNHMVHQVEWWNGSTVNIIYSSLDLDVVSRRMWICEKAVFI